jgi:ABC-type sugar transport system permease subunit
VIIISKRITIETKKSLQGMGFISIWVLGLLLFWIYPLIASLVMSLSKVTPNAYGLALKFIGFENYRHLILQDANFWNRLLPFLTRTIIIIPIITVFAIIMALLLNQKFYGRGFFRAVFFLPVLFTTGSIIIRLLTEYGGSSNIAASASSTTVSFLQNQTLIDIIQENFKQEIADAIINIVNSFIIILWYSGIQIVLLIAGLQSIGASIYEAASIDGATGWESLWKITLPGITPFILIAAVYTVVDQLTVPSNPIMELINNASNDDTLGMGYATAMSWIFQILVMLLIGFIFLIFRKSITSKDRKGV